MKRRTLIFGGGALATLSLGTTATNAALADAVSAAADFRVIDNTFEATSFSANPDTENTESTHEWEVDFTTDQNVTSITADYDFDTDAASFDPLDDGQITVEFLQNGKLSSVKLANETYSGSTATFTIDDNNAFCEGRAVVTIGDTVNGNPGIVNPSADAYEPTLTFDNGSGDTVTYEATLSTQSDTSTTFVPTITNAPTAVNAGDTATVEFDVENTGGSEATKDVDFLVDGTKESSQSFTIGAGETKSSSFDYSTTESDAPDITAEVSTDSDSDSTTINVVGVWSVSLTNTGGNDAVHNWTTQGINFTGEINTITIKYQINDRNRLNFDKSNPTVTVRLTNDGDSTKSDINITNTTTASGGNEATFTLDSGQNTSIDDNNESEVVIDSLRDPKSNSVDATITLDGDDSYDDTVTINF